MSTLSVFIDTPAVPPHPEAKLLAAFKKIPIQKKCILLEGYLNEDGQTFVPPLVWKIKQQIVTDPTLSSEYPSCSGVPEFSRRVTELALGKDCCAIVENRVLGVQTVGSTGAVRLGAELLRRWYNLSANWRGPVYLSSPCDGRLLAGIFEAAGILDIRQYRYWDAERRGVSVESLLEDLEEAPEQAVVVLSASGHHPTGADLSQKDWRLVIEVMMAQPLPFLPAACAGPVFGDPEQDAWPLHHCASMGLELLCAQSFSRNSGLYGERVGHLLIVLKQNSMLLAIQSQAESLVRTLWSCPAVGGARVVATVLNNPAHLAEWREGLRGAVERCMLVRERLREKLRILGAPGDWDHLTQQGGLYSCTGLSGQQVEYLSKRRHVYLLPNGCLNMSCINSRNLDYVAESIYLALTSHP